MRKIYFFITLGFCSLMTVAQEQSDSSHSVKQDFIDYFFQEHTTTEDVRLNVQCEYSLLYDQYEQSGQEINQSLVNVFQSILTSYENQGELDTSHRLFPIEEMDHSHVHGHDITGINFYYNPQIESGELDKPIGGNDEIKSNGCVDADFEGGVFGSWALGWGTSGPFSINPGINDGGMNSTSGQHAIMGPGAGNDVRSGGNVPRVYPGGGQYSLRLGDEGTGYRAAQASYTFTVTPSTELFVYHYAVVMQDPGHGPSDQPFFDIKLVVDGVPQPCGNYYQAAAANVPGYQSNGSVRYKNWTTVSVSLTPYMGAQATITFTSVDCSAGGHYGYAYIDAECLPMPTLAGETISCLHPVQTISGPPGASTYNWTGPGIVGSSSGQSIQVNEGGDYQVQVIPVQGPACAYVLNVHVDEQLGEVEADFTATPTQVCLGEPISFEDISTYTLAAGPVSTWDWDFGDGTSGSTANPTHTYTSPGIYTVGLEVMTTNHCDDATTRTVIVSPNPVSDFTVTSECFNVENIFSDQSSVDNTNGDYITTWNWDFGDGTTSAVQNPTHEYGAENVYDVNLEVTTNNGCSHDVTLQAVVYPLPDVDFSSTNVCLNSVTNLTDLSSVSNLHTTNSNVTYAWDLGDGNTSTDQNPENIYPDEGFYTVHLTVTTDKGCEASETGEITVYPNPVVNFVPTEVCHEAPTEFSDQSTVSNAYTTNSVVAWNWNFGDGNTSNLQNPENTYFVEGIYDAILMVTTNNGCTSVDTIPVTVFPNPVSLFVVDSVCNGVTSTYSDLSTVNPANGDFITQWNWSFGDGGTSSNPNPSHLYTLEGVYTVSLLVTTNNGCTHESEEITHIFPNPFVDFSGTEECLNFTTVFTDLSSVSNAHTSNQNVQWNWSFGNGQTSNLQHPTHLYSEDGLYNVTLVVTSNNGCETTTTMPVRVFPQPVAGFTGVELEGCSPICPSLQSTSVINNPSNIQQYIWTFSDGQIFYGPNPTVAMCYENNTGVDDFYDVNLKVISEHGCESEHFEANYISVYHNPIANFYFEPFNPDVIDPVVDFYNTSRYADYYDWEIDYYGHSNQFDVLNVEFPSTHPDQYVATLTATTEYGCWDTISQALAVLDKVVYYVPNTFTPDNDDYNEVFKPVFTNGYDPYKYTLFIFNRWGELLFESHDVNVGWDGTYGESSEKLVKDGTYVWKIVFKESMTDKYHTVVGHVNLLK